MSPLSIVIPTQDQASELRTHLPAIMEQDYDDFEVIVVDMASTDQTKDVLEELELRYPSLRHTRTPSTARDISLERLALTLGIRSARHEWVVITHANCQPATPQWLQTLSQQMTEDKSIVLGVAKYDEQHHTWFDNKVAFFRLWNTFANLSHTRRGHAAVRADGCNLALRRSLFLNKNGLGDHLNLLTGAEELLVNRLSTPTNTAICNSPDAIVIEDHLPDRRLWKKSRVFYIETRRHQHHTLLYRFRQNLLLLTPWVLLVALAATWPLLHHFLPGEDIAAAIITALVSLLVITAIGVWINRWNFAAHAIGYERNHYLTIPLFTLELPFWHLGARLAHRFASKTDFYKKFV